MSASPRSTLPFARRSLRIAAVTLTAVSVTAALVSTVNAPAEAGEKPSKISAMGARPGPDAGEITIRWESDGRKTDYYRVETALSTFSKTNPDLPYNGRNKHVYTVSGDRTSVTLSHRQLYATGASISSAQQVYFRVYAVNAIGESRIVRAYPYLRAARVTPLASRGDVPIRAGSFNVRTVTRGDTGDRAWSNRVDAVATTILSRRPGVVGLQELSPGPANRQPGGTRQTTTLLHAVHTHGGGSYALVREKSYARGGTVTGNQGTRILYDTERYKLVSNCAEVSVVDGRRVPYSDSCAFQLPARASDSDKQRHWVSYALFADRRTGVRFWFVSAHLDHRQSSNDADQRSFEANRGEQAAFIARRMSAINDAGYPIVFTGDINSWQNITGGYLPHRALVAAGYYDTAAAVRTVNLAYSTKNNFDTRVQPKPLGFGARLDTIMVKGVKGANRFENVVQRVDPDRASDHNLVVSDFRLPR